jgi:hypothetical protein
MAQDENTNNENIQNTDSLELLHRLKREVFDGSDEELAVAMGRPESEIIMWFTKGEEIDDDAEMKIRGIAKERLSEV